MEHAQLAEIAALLGALGAVGALIPRGGIFPLVGLALLGRRRAVSRWSLVGDDDVELLLHDPAGLALVAHRASPRRSRCAVPLARYPRGRPGRAARRRAVPRPRPAGRRGGIPAPAAVPRDRSRRARARLPDPPRRATSAAAVPARAPAGGVRDAGVHVVPLDVGRARRRNRARVLRLPLRRRASRPSRAARSRTGSRARCSCTLVALGTLFAAIGIWQAHTRTLFFARDVEVANAYTSFFRVTSLFKDPSLYGRYLVVPIAVLLVAILIRRGRTVDWVVATGVRRVPVLGPLLLVLAVELRRAVRRDVRRRGRRRRRADANRPARLRARRDARSRRRGGRGDRGTLGEGRDERALAARRRHGRGVQGAADRRRGHRRPAAASSEIVGKGSPSRNASHTTPLTVLAELGVIGFALYAWLLAAAGWALVLVARTDRAFGVGLAAVLLALVVHSLLYAGFFEDPLTWGVIGLACGGARPRTEPRARLRTATDASPARSGAAGTLTPGRRDRPFASCRKPSSGSSPRSRCSCSRSSVSRSAIAVVTREPDRGCARHRPRGRHRVGRPTTAPEPEPEPEPEPDGDRRCWRSFGGDPQRSLARPDATLGLPAQALLLDAWARQLHRVPAVLLRGRRSTSTPSRATTFAIEAETGKIRWTRRVGGTLPSSPAIDGPRILVASQDGTVTALASERGSTALAGADGREGRVVARRRRRHGVLRLARRAALRRRARRPGASAGRTDAGGASTRARRSSAAASASRRMPARSSASTARTGEELWTTYLKRDAFRYESFYASPSTDGARLYSLSPVRQGRRARRLERRTSSGPRGVGGLGYTTPAVADGRVFAGGFDGRLRAFRATNGEELWSTETGGRILGAPVVIGDLRLLLDAREANVSRCASPTGRSCGGFPLGSYSPGIATERTYFFSLNGRLIAIPGRDAVALPSADSRGWRRRHSGERWSSDAAAFHAASRASIRQAERRRAGAEPERRRRARSRARRGVSRDRLERERRPRGTSRSRQLRTPAVGGCSSRC